MWLYTYNWAPSSLAGLRAELAEQLFLSSCRGLLFADMLLCKMGMPPSASAQGYPAALTPATDVSLKNSRPWTVHAGSGPSLKVLFEDLPHDPTGLFTRAPANRLSLAQEPGAPEASGNLLTLPERGTLPWTSTPASAATDKHSQRRVRLVV